jgi:GNAT superfamily N-acetyltransferase
MTQSSTLRDVRPGDEGTVLRFIRALAEYEHLSHEVRITENGLRAALFGPNPRAHALLAEIGAEPAGYAMWLYKFSSFAGVLSLFVEDVFVEPARRGEGVGRAIFCELARRAIAEGCGRMEWAVLDWNAPAIAFYRGIGAKPVPGWTTYGIDGPAFAALAA